MPRWLATRIRYFRTSSTVFFNETTQKNIKIKMRFLIFAAIVATVSANSIATASSDVCMDRFPGMGYGYCNADQTCVHGGPLCHLVAVSFLEADASADFALQNGGGCKQSIAAGDVMSADVYAVLPYNNNLMSFEMTGRDIIDMLNELLLNAYDVAGGANSGSYPYAAGLRFNVNMAQQGNNEAPIVTRARLTSTRPATLSAQGCPCRMSR